MLFKQIKYGVLAFGCAHTIQQERRINMFEEIRDRVLRANLALAEHGLVTLTWGNVSEIDRNEGIIAIKPSGVKYETMRAEDIVILDPDGKKLTGI